MPPRHHQRHAPDGKDPKPDAESLSDDMLVGKGYAFLVNKGGQPGASRKKSPARRGALWSRDHGLALRSLGARPLRRASRCAVRWFGLPLTLNHQGPHHVVLLVLENVAVPDVLGAGDSGIAI